MYSHSVLKLVESMCLYLSQYVLNCGPVLVEPTVLYFVLDILGQSGSLSLI